MHGHTIVGILGQEVIKKGRSSRMVEIDLPASGSAGQCREWQCAPRGPHRAATSALDRGPGGAALVTQAGWWRRAGWCGAGVCREHRGAGGAGCGAGLSHEAGWCSADGAAGGVQLVVAPACRRAISLGHTVSTFEVLSLGGSSRLGDGHGHRDGDGGTGRGLYP